MRLRHWLGPPPAVNVREAIVLRALSLPSTITAKQEQGALPSICFDGGQHGFVAPVVCTENLIRVDDEMKSPKLVE
jgi:hypothetical protein